ncbi:hypothetical protein E2C01_055661 [Portunus trituberculatus]|uniref:Uncharacterized protein n=1 Tax=Portunus trituberculatus TaxID=210409 RepID=A0A5B7GWJ7_PORTR|nr:hypothetical protein [Portunus trituberculatus]
MRSMAEREGVRYGEKAEEEEKGREDEEVEDEKEEEEEEGAASLRQGYGGSGPRADCGIALRDILSKTT